MTIRMPPITALRVSVSLRKIIPKMTAKIGNVNVARVTVKAFRPL